jgi:hypothetical protein
MVAVRFVKVNVVGITANFLATKRYESGKDCIVLA